MKAFRIMILVVSVFLKATCLFGESAAPSMHLTYYFPSSDAILKMQKIKITQTAPTSYFEVNSFNGGYSGLQQTPDVSFGNFYIFIASLWDKNTAGGVYSAVEYRDPTTFIDRFGGEGDGCKTINPYGWSTDTWYNIVQRAWLLNGKLFIASFINDLSTNKWFHTSTLSVPYSGTYLQSYNDAFLENWDGSNSNHDGRFVREAFYKDLWNLNISGTWEKNTSAYFSANDSQADKNRNGIYHDSFNAGYDATENVYFMKHGGSTTHSFSGRTLSLPGQGNQGTTPSLTVGNVASVSVDDVNGLTKISWVVDETKSPQLSSKVEILDAGNTVIRTLEEILPQRRNCDLILSPGNYTVRITITDIFNQVSTPVTKGFTVSEPVQPCPIATFPWTENFEGATFPPDCWASYKEGSASDPNQWAKTTTGGHEGSAGAYHERTGTGIYDADGWIVTPAIAIPATGEYELKFRSRFTSPPSSFYHSNATGSTISKITGVYVSTTDDLVPSFYNKKSFTTGEITLNTWQEFTMSLNEYAGKTIYIAFRYMGAATNAWYIDDVSVRNTNPEYDCSVYTFPWTEDFEGYSNVGSPAAPPDCWTRYHTPYPGSGQTVWQARVQQPDPRPGSGETYVNHSWGTAGSGNMDDGWLITPKLVLPDNDDYVLTFWTVFNSGNGTRLAGDYSVRISDTDNDKSSFTTTLKQMYPSEYEDAVVMNPGATYPNNTWAEVEIDLSDYTGKSVYIAFVKQGIDVISWGIDDVNVNKAISTDLETQSAVSPRAWIQNGKLHVTGLAEGEVWSIYTVTGTLISRGTASSGETEIALPAQGAYIMQTEARSMKVIY